MCAPENSGPGTASPEVKMLRKQVSRLDPANKSLRFRGFASESVQVRVETIEKIIRDLGGGICSCEHIYKGPVGSRILTDMCVVELTSNSIRERILKDAQGKSFQDPPRAELIIDRAKTAFQVHYLQLCIDKG